PASHSRRRLPCPSRTPRSSPKTPSADSPAVHSHSPDSGAYPIRQYPRTPPPPPGLPSSAAPPASCCCQTQYSDTPPPPPADTSPGPPTSASSPPQTSPAPSH